MPGVADVYVFGSLQKKVEKNITYMVEYRQPEINNLQMISGI